MTYDASRLPFLWPFRRSAGHGADRTEGRPTIDDPVSPHAPVVAMASSTPPGQLPTPPAAPTDYVTQILAPAAWQYIRDYNAWNAASLQAIYGLLYRSSNATQAAFALQQQQLGTSVLALQAMQTELAGIIEVLDQLLRFQRSPVRGRIHVHVGKDQPRMTIPVHPSDTITFDVAWENAENLVVPEISPTTWDTVDASGASVAVGALSADPASDDRGSLAPPLALGSFFLQATTHDDHGAAVVARSSEDINVSDTNPARGTVHVSVAPGA